MTPPNTLTRRVRCSCGLCDAIAPPCAEAKLEETKPTSWEELMDPLERVSEQLSRPWGVVSHLKGVRDSEALREAYGGANLCHVHTRTKVTRLNSSCFISYHQ